MVVDLRSPLMVAALGVSRKEPVPLHSFILQRAARMSGEPYCRQTCWPGMTPNGSQNNAALERTQNDVFYQQ